MTRVFIVNVTINYYENKVLQKNQEIKWQGIISSFEVLSQLCLERIKNMEAICGHTILDERKDKYTSLKLLNLYENYIHEPITILSEIFKMYDIDDNKSSSYYDMTIDVIPKIMDQLWY
jgi:hypothetical protein